MTDAHFRQRDLARRLGLSPRTLEGWRWRGTGRQATEAAQTPPAPVTAPEVAAARPARQTLSLTVEQPGRVEAFEETQLRQSTPRRSKSRSSTICTKAEGDA